MTYNLYIKVSHIFTSFKVDYGINRVHKRESMREKIKIEKAKDDSVKNFKSY